MWPEVYGKWILSSFAKVLSPAPGSELLDCSNEFETQVTNKDFYKQKSQRKWLVCRTTK